MKSYREAFAQQAKADMDTYYHLVFGPAQQPITPFPADVAGEAVQELPLARLGVG